MNDGDGGDIRCGERGRIIGDRGDEEGNIIRDVVEQNSNQSGAVECDGAGISLGVCADARGRRPPSSRDRKLPTWLDQGGKNMELQYFEGFKKRCDRVFTELQRSDGQLVRDIFRFEDPREYQDFLNCIQRDGNYRRGLLQICREDTHVHIVHDCNFSNGSCRCNWYKKAKTYGADRRRDRRGHRRDSCRSRTPTDIQMLLLYYCTKGRYLTYSKIGGIVEAISDEGYNIPKSGFVGSVSWYREMEIEAPGDGDQLQCWGPSFSDAEEDERRPTEVPRRKKRKVGESERISMMVEKLLYQYPITPPEAIIKHRVWRDIPELKFKNLKHDSVQAGVSVYRDSLISYKMSMYQDIYSKEDCVPIFSAGYSDYYDYYYNIDQSIDVIDKLISFQCDDDPETIHEFVKCLYDVLERKHPKLNTIVLHSPPTAGKNFLIDAVKDYYINVGTFGYANKYNCFPWQDAEARRLIHWNEPNYSPEYLEDIKKLLGGDSTSVNVKYKSNIPVYRTPVIVTTNNVVTFMTHPSFEDRLKVFYWDKAPFLKDYVKKPNPLAIYHYFKKYDLVD
uniref:NS1 n=1 Tax=uncultured densovirus TaxID=748192 RepID=A0A7M4BC22_9VIRU|nr:NS1 [uncultured densovirus]